MNAPEFPQPVTLDRSEDDLARDFPLVEFDRCREPGWHFRMMVRRDSRLGPQGADPPSPAAPMQTLALLQRTDGPCDIEVYGHELQREVDPADWLDLWAEGVGLAVVSRRSMPGAGGTDGDIVATWSTPQGPFAGRMLAMKWGRRLYVIALRTPLARYAALADDFFVSLASFTPLEPDLDGLFAENVQAFGGDHPVPWRVPVPGSWTVQPDAIDERLCSFQAAAIQPPSGSCPPGPASFGKMAFGLATASLFPTVHVAARTFLDELEAGHVTLADDALKREPTPPPPFGESWLLVSPATLDRPPLRAFPCEVRCRVLRHESLCFVSGVVGPGRDGDALAWMRNKRALDLLAQHIQVSIPG